MQQLQGITASEFERNAGSTARHPSDNIYVHNNLTFKDIICAAKGETTLLKSAQALRAVLLQGPTTEAVQAATGPDVCKLCRHEGKLVQCSNEECGRNYHPGMGWGYGVGVG